MAEINVVQDRVLPAHVTTKEQHTLNGADIEAFVSQRYTYNKSEKVEDFLLIHPKVAHTLFDAIPQIEKFFGEGTGVSLRVSCDQESDPTLSANIQTSLDVSEARAARKKFNVSWWMHQSEMNELPLSFNIEYV